MATPAGAVVGSMWTEGNTVHYIDSTGIERYVDGPYIASQAPAGALAGSMWFDTGYAPSTSKGQLHFIGAAQHEHWAHNDTAFNNAHTDTAFGNSHTDADAGSSHYDYHADHWDVDDPGLHADAHENSHYNVHSNAHTDTAFNNAHTDVAHIDQPTAV